MAAVSVKHLFEAGAHFGHKTKKWHPKMKEYIYGAKSGIYIIDLRKTLEKLKEAYEYAYGISANGGKILMVGTKFQARETIEEEARRSDSFFVNLRWLGGMLTNFSTIKQSIGKLKKLEDIAGPERDYMGILKKEAVRMERSRRKLEAVLQGILELRKKPAAIFIIDIKRESIAFKEARKLGIPVIAVVDTNCDPRGVDYIIPGNDDSIHCIKLFTSVVASAVIEGRKTFDAKVAEIKAEKERIKNAEKKEKSAAETKTDKETVQTAVKEKSAAEIKTDKETVQTAAKEKTATETKTGKETEQAAPSERKSAEKIEPEKVIEKMEPDEKSGSEEKV